MKHHGIVVRAGVALLLAVGLPGCHRTRVATLDTVGRVHDVAISTPAGVMLLPRSGAGVGSDIGCVASRLTATLESVRGDTLMLMDVRVLKEVGSASRCAASAFALVTTGRNDLTIVVREPALGRTIIGSGLLGGILTVLGLAVAVIAAHASC